MANLFNNLSKHKIKSKKEKISKFQKKQGSLPTTVIKIIKNISSKSVTIQTKNTLADLLIQSCDEFFSNFSTLKVLFDSSLPDQLTPFDTLNLLIECISILRSKIERISLTFSPLNSTNNIYLLSLNDLIDHFNQHISQFSSSFYSLLNHFIKLDKSQSLSDDLLKFDLYIKETEEKLSAKFNMQSPDFDSLIQFFESFAEIQPDIQEIDRKAAFLFQQQESLPLKIKSLANQFLLF
jgi:hypothetical protein